MPPEAPASLTANPGRIAVIGLGNMGMSALGAMLERGLRVIAVDIDEEKLAALRAGKCLVPERGAEEILRRGLAEGRLTVERGFADAAHWDVAFLAVQTPSSGLECDYRALRAVMSELAKRLPDDRLVVVGSTVFPGAIHREILPFWSGRKVDVVYQPVFLRAGFGIDDFLRPGKIILGVADPNQPPIRLVQLMNAILVPGLRPAYVSYAESEWIKVVHNAFMSLKIAFSNEISLLCDGHGVDAARVIELTLQENEYGRLLTRSHTVPGIPFSGPCLPKDADVLQGMVLASKHPEQLKQGVCFALRESNNAYRQSYIDRWLEFAKTPDQSLGIIGMAFRPGFNEMRESLALSFVREADRRGIAVLVYDPAFENADESEYRLACRQNEELLGLRHRFRSLEDVWSGCQGVLINRRLDDGERQRIKTMKTPPMVDLYANPPLADATKSN